MLPLILQMHSFILLITILFYFRNQNLLVSMPKFQKYSCLIFFTIFTVTTCHFVPTHLNFKNLNFKNLNFTNSSFKHSNLIDPFLTLLLTLTNKLKLPHSLKILSASIIFGLFNQYPFLTATSLASISFYKHHISQTFLYNILSVTFSGWLLLTYTSPVNLQKTREIQNFDPISTPNFNNFPNIEITCDFCKQIEPETKKKLLAETLITVNSIPWNCMKIDNCNENNFEYDASNPKHGESQNPGVLEKKGYFYLKTNDTMEALKAFTQAEIYDHKKFQIFSLYESSLIIIQQLLPKISQHFFLEKAESRLRLCLSRLKNSENKKTPLFLDLETEHETEHTDLKNSINFAIGLIQLNTNRQPNLARLRLNENVLSEMPDFKIFTKLWFDLEWNLWKAGGFDDSESLKSCINSIDPGMKTVQSAIAMANIAVKEENPKRAKLLAKLIFQMGRKENGGQGSGEIKGFACLIDSSLCEYANVESENVEKMNVEKMNVGKRNVEKRNVEQKSVGNTVKVESSGIENSFLGAQKSDPNLKNEIASEIDENQDKMMKRVALFFEINQQKTTGGGVISELDQIQVQNAVGYLDSLLETLTHQ